MPTNPTATDIRRWEQWDDLRARQEAATTDAEIAALKLEEDAMRDAGMKELMHQDMSQEPVWFWLSFVDEDGTFLGVSIIEAGGIMEATVKARMHGCNPGGEVRAYPLDYVPEERLRNRLFSKAELEAEGLIAVAS
jgi:hypothetical protein